jgi:hypothetical protein
MRMKKENKMEFITFKQFIYTICVRYYNEDIQYWDKPEQFWQGYVGGPKFRIATMDYNDIDMPIGIYVDYKDEDEFRKWIDKLFSFGEKYLDNGYLPMWHKVLTDDDYEDCE